ncbi:MAG: DUF4838 domain-containing protein [Clostridia bacterium]|nr:DUF4838 domain-containing protein [Clostridia bacterium]
MKSVISVLLSLLLLLPLLISCGETTPSESGSPESVSSYHEDLSETEPIPLGEVDPFADSDPLPADLQIPECVKNADGTVIGTIVLPAAASEDKTLSFAAEELRYHFEKVTGANLPIVGRTGDEYGSIVLATPDTLPFVAEQFSDDIAWLADLGSLDTGSKFGSDGFSIRKLGDDIYVIGNTARGTLNGVYDLIEENLGVLWIRANEEEGLIYSPLEAAVIAKTDYREKSPFEYRGWHLCGEQYPTPATELLNSRNKLNTASGVFSEAALKAIAVRKMPFTHNVKSLILTSPIYDPDEAEYWNTDQEGNWLSPEASKQINFWSEKALEVLTASVIEKIKAENLSVFFIGVEDNYDPVVLPESGLPYEYEPGKRVSPDDASYISTVYFSFINKVAKAVKEECPECTLATFAYLTTVRPPKCQVEDNILVVYAPCGDNLTAPFFDRDRTNTQVNWLGYVNGDLCEFLEEWTRVCDHLCIYNYYGCQRASAYYEMPIEWRIQGDLQGYRELGIEGVTPEGCCDSEYGINPWINQKKGVHTYLEVWAMHTLSFWVYSKLAWNPDLDVDALIVEFCDKVYGNASSLMQEYYSLIKQGWDYGNAGNDKLIDHDANYSTFYSYYIKGPGINETICNTLIQAYDTAEGAAKARIGAIKDIVVNHIVEKSGFTLPENS